MSRSYKKCPIHTDGRTPGPKISKRYANKKARHTKDLPTRQRNAFKKCFCSYDIHDYVSRWTLQDAIDEWEEEETMILNGSAKKESWKKHWHDKYENIEAYLQAIWYKYYYRK